MTKITPRLLEALVPRATCDSQNAGPERSKRTFRARGPLVEQKQRIENNLREVRTRKALCAKRGYMRFYITAEWEESGLVYFLKKVNRELRKEARARNGAVHRTGPYGRSYDQVFLLPAVFARSGPDPVRWPCWLSAVPEMQNAMNTNDSKCPVCDGEGGSISSEHIYYQCNWCEGTGQNPDALTTLPKDDKDIASGPPPLAFGGEQDQEASQANSRALCRLRTSVALLIALITQVVAVAAAYFHYNVTAATAEWFFLIAFKVVMDAHTEAGRERGACAQCGAIEPGSPKANEKVSNRL